MTFSMCTFWGVGMRRSFDTKSCFNLLTSGLTSLIFFLLILCSWFPAASAALAGGLTVLSDEELDLIDAKGFYFQMSLNIEAFTAGSTPPQVVINTGTPLIIPTANTSSFAGPASSISLSGNAQSNISSLVNVIGATSVINVGVNIVSIVNSSNDVINTTNINAGAQGADFNITFGLLP